MNRTGEGDPQAKPDHPTMVALVWRRLVVVMTLSASPVTEAFAFTASPPPGARATAPAPSLLSGRFAGARGAATAAGPAAFHPTRAGAGRGGALERRARSEDDDNNKIDVLTGSGLRGTDTSKLTGNDKRDAEWFQRTAEREARGGLQWFEDPAVYIGLCLLVPVVILVWGVLNCYIPGFCPSTF